MGCHYGLLIFTISIFYMVEICTTADRKCTISKTFHQCSIHETCQQQVDDEGICKCESGYSRKEVNGPCLPTSTSPQESVAVTTEDAPVSTQLPPPPGVSASTIAAVVLVPLFLFLVVGLVYAARRYQWLHRMRHFRTRRYDEVRIGQEDDDDDDPPIA